MIMDGLWNSLASRTSTLFGCVDGSDELGALGLLDVVFDEVQEVIAGEY